MLINKVNDILEEKCATLGFTFIKHDNIKKVKLWRNGVHLQESGKILLANNFIDYLNEFINQTVFVHPNSH